MKSPPLEATPTATRQRQKKLKYLQELFPENDIFPQLLLFVYINSFASTEV